MEAWLYHKFFEIETKHWWFVGRERIVSDLVERRCGLKPGARILDVGCGTGGVLQQLSARYQAFGMDASPLAIELCRKRGLEQVQVGLLGDFPPQNPGFDLIMFLDVIEHIPDHVQVLKEARPHLAPTGLVMITVPAYPWLWTAHDDANHHQRRYTRKTLLETLHAAGLAPMFVSYCNTLLFPAALLERAGQRLRPKESAPNRPDPSLKMPPRLLNAWLTRIFASERFWLRSFRFPFGLSLVAIARQNG